MTAVGGLPSRVLMVLLNLFEKRLIFTAKWTTACRHRTRDASLKTICNHLIAQWLWKKNGSHWKRLLDTLTIVADCQDARPEEWPKLALFEH